MQARHFPSGILNEASQIRKKGRAQQTHRNSLFRGILDPFGVFPRKFCANCVGALKPPSVYPKAASAPSGDGGGGDNDDSE
jgi:hypothetical protein